MEDSQRVYKDPETGLEITITNPNFIGPIARNQDGAYIDDSCLVQIGSDAPRPVAFQYPSAPKEKHEIAMIETLKRFDMGAWFTKNTGIKTGFKCIDEAFEGGLYPGFIVIGGDSNVGKSALITQLAWQITQNNDDVYVMDFSLDDALPDKISRLAACAGRLPINVVKTPLNYQDNPLMLIRRKKALLKIEAIADKYCVYDSTFSCFVEDIEREIEAKLIYFDSDDKHNKRRIVICIDNFHDLNVSSQPGLREKDKFDYLAQWCSDIAKKHDLIVICSAELRKLNGTKRPTLDDIRENVKIKYEAKAVLLVYNEVHYQGEAATVFYTDGSSPCKQPIFEIHFAKNKFGAYKGRNFFKFYPSMATLEECDAIAQGQYSAAVYG